MSNFDFMNSGLLESDGGAYENSFHEYITALLSLFITKSLENAVKYIDICNRNGITKNEGINVFMLKHFLKEIQKYGGFETYGLLFGESNVSISGSVVAKNKKGKTYKTYFGKSNNKKILSVIEREKYNKINEIH